MKYRYISLQLLILFSFFNIVGFSQNKLDSTKLNSDSVIFDLENPYSVSVDTAKIVKKPIVSIAQDTVKHKAKLPKEVKLKTPFTPSPQKAVIYSLICPGLGQIYNKKYWKLPIVYGGFLGVGYAISWNGGLYGDYKKAYKDIVLDPTGTTSWHNFVSNSENVLNNPTLLKQQTDRLKRRRDYFRRNRDLAIIVGVGLYVLCLVDAYVDASLYNFNITPDLSMTAVPSVWKDSNYSSKPVVGLQCNFTF